LSKRLMMNRSPLAALLLLALLRATARWTEQ
jgi:hypothetical protein